MMRCATCDADVFCPACGGRLAGPVKPEAARKIGGSYQADGWIVARFKTRDGRDRVVFEFSEPAGMLHIFSPEQVERR